jgi:AraC family transcriptional regulator of adaptative response/methylated-DNA-[protein]-cysteine methyltransferase
MAKLLNLVQHEIATPLGQMIAIADNKALYLLEFANSKGLPRKLAGLRAKASITQGSTAITSSIEKELELYFAGSLKQFKTPTALLGTPFQNQVWQALQKIPFNKTCSYADIAQAIGNPSAFRAVAITNARNQLAVIIPCHRVIKKNGDLCGYNGGIERKEWLLKHEQGNLPKNAKSFDAYLAARLTKEEISEIEFQAIREKRSLKKI